MLCTPKIWKHLHDKRVSFLNKVNVQIPQQSEKSQADFKLIYKKKNKRKKLRPDTDVPAFDNFFSKQYTRYIRTLRKTYPFPFFFHFSDQKGHLLEITT